MKRAMHTDPTIAVAYIRVSTDDQNLGPEAQRASIAAWAARQGARVAAWFTDQGVSGGKPVEDRPALLAALEAVRTPACWWPASGTASPATWWLRRPSNGSRRMQERGW